MLGILCKVIANKLKAILFFKKNNIYYCRFVLFKKEGVSLQVKHLLLILHLGSEMVNSDHLSFSLFTLTLPPWAVITWST